MTTLPRLFDREVVLDVDGVRITSRAPDSRPDDIAAILRVQFKITKTSKKEPNKADITIYNLSQDNRTFLASRKDPVATLEAGYRDNVSQIFKGDMGFVGSTLDGVDWVTTIQTVDGAKAFKGSRANVSFKGPTKIEDVLNVLASSLGVDPGNVKDKVRTGSIRQVISDFKNGFAATGKAEKILDRVVKTMGYSWSIQDNELRIQAPNEPLIDEAITLGPSTGLVGSPEVGEKGKVKARALLQPQLLPTAQVSFDSFAVSGPYLIERVDFVGDTWGNDWFADIECVPL